MRANKLQEKYVAEHNVSTFFQTKFHSEQDGGKKPLCVSEAKRKTLHMIKH